MSSARDTTEGVGDHASGAGYAAGGAGGPAAKTGPGSPDVPANVADLVRRAAAADPAKIALYDASPAGDDAITWGDLEAKVDRLARAVRARGGKPGDRVALLLSNGIDLVVAYFGVLRAGLVAVPLNPSYTANEVSRVLVDSGSWLLISAGGPAYDVPTASVADLLGTAADGPAVASPGAYAGGEDPAVLLYTSGTAGHPKGAVLSHRALLANVEQVARIEPPAMATDDVVLLALPLYHIYGLNAGLGAVAYHGATGVLARRFDPVATLGQIAARSVTVVLGAPPMFLAWSLLPGVGEAFRTVRLAVSGAAPLAAAVHAALLERTGRHVAEGYGLTETGPVLTTTLGSEVPKAGSIGRPVPGVELRLVDERRAEVTEDPGEIEVCGPNLFSGYWPDGHDGPDADGWFATGDVAYADEDGDLFLVDRRRDLILVSGFNVYPREVEEVLARHPDIAEVAVIGIPHPYTGQAVKALVRLNDGAGTTAGDVTSFAARSLARFKSPTTVEFVSDLPHTGTGKVAKGRLRAVEGGPG